MLHCVLTSPDSRFMCTLMKSSPWTSEKQTINANDMKSFSENWLLKCDKQRFLFSSTHNSSYVYGVSAQEREKLKDSRASRDSKVTGRVSFPFKFCCETYNNGSMSEHWKWALQNNSTVCVISLESKPTSDRRRRRYIMSRCPYQIGSIARSPPSYGASQCSQCVSLPSILSNEWLCASPYYKFIILSLLKFQNS